MKKIYKDAFENLFQVNQIFAEKLERAQEALEFDANKSNTSHNIEKESDENEFSENIRKLKMPGKDGKMAPANIKKE